MELFNLYSIMVNYVFGSIPFAIFGFAVVLFIIGRMFRISIPTQISILVVYSISLVTIAVGPMIAFVCFVGVVFYFMSGLLRVLLSEY